MKRIEMKGQQSAVNSKQQRSKTMEKRLEMTKDQQELYKQYANEVLATYCRPEKVSCAASLTNAWRTGLTIEESIAHCKQYNQRVYKGQKTWGQVDDQIFAHRKTMYDWYGLVIRKENGKLVLDFTPAVALVFGFWYGSHKKVS